ncbi:hypothetical protein DERP_014809 [Dermatophagoides pteronyssinus]|uniref:Uncharacterized protein n=1 Tax=Dermatophagoides pteronyssinus TaxID=6956 RepID=A0ABQ8J2N0_DERPT|nr:hypothetical protein DERP_014809 [Dermatophagoides pteronyssinus]
MPHHHADRERKSKMASVRDHLCIIYTNCEKMSVRCMVVSRTSHQYRFLITPLDFRSAEHRLPTVLKISNKQSLRSNYTMLFITIF